MPRKKKIVQEDGFKFDFTGKINIIIEQSNYGPLQITANDKDFVLKVLRLFMKTCNGKSPVNSYNKREEKKLQKMMDEIK